MDKLNWIQVTMITKVTLSLATCGGQSKESIKENIPNQTETLINFALWWIWIAVLHIITYRLLLLLINSVLQHTAIKV